MSEAPNEQLIAVQNKVADLTEALAVTQGVVNKINTIVTNINSVLTASLASQSGVNALTPVTISPISTQSIGLQISATGSTPASGAFTANMRCYVPFYVTNTVTVLDAWLLNGTGTIAGNVDVTIYTSALAKVVGTGSIAQATPGGQLLQKLAIADTALAPGNYYMSIAFSDATATAFRWTTDTRWHRPMGVFFQSAAFTAPATATPAALDDSIPFFGITTSSAFV